MDLTLAQTLVVGLTAIPIIIGAVLILRESIAMTCMIIGLLIGMGVTIATFMALGWWPDGPIISIIPMFTFIGGGMFIGGEIGFYLEFGSFELLR